MCDWHPGEDLGRSYGLDLVAAPVRCTGGYVHHSWRVQTVQGSWFVKHYAAAGWSQEGIVRTLQVQEAATAAGLPVPRVLRTRGGEMIAAVAGGFLVVMQWLGGESGGRSLKQARAAGDALGRLHAVLARLPAAGDRLAPGRAAIMQRAQALLEMERERGLGGEAGELARQAAEYRLAACGQEPLGEEVYGAARWQVCHGDFYPPNLLFHQDEVSGIVDWDFAGPRWRVMEVARAAVEAGGGADGAWRPDVACALLEAYHEQNPLSARERVYGFWLWWEYLLWSLYPWPLPYTAPDQVPADWLALAKRRHGLLVWLGEHQVELAELGAGLKD